MYRAARDVSVPAIVAMSSVLMPCQSALFASVHRYDEHLVVAIDIRGENKQLALRRDRGMILVASARYKSHGRIFINADSKYVSIVCKVDDCHIRREERIIGEAKGFCLCPKRIHLYGG